MIRIEKMTIDDIAVVVQQEEAVFGHSLGYAMFYQELTNNCYAYYYVIKNQGMIFGHIGCRIMPPMAEVINFYVMPDYQNQGFGSIMLDYVIALCKTYNVESLSLEVRPSNMRARRMYRQKGFMEVLVRPNYYPNHEDAILMIKDFK